MPAMGFVQVAFQSSVQPSQIIKFLEIRGFKQAENGEENQLTYKDKTRFDGEIICSLELKDKLILSIYPGGHPFQNMNIFVQQLCLDFREVLHGEILGFMKGINQASIESLVGESQSEILFHNGFSKFINQSVLIDMLLRDFKDEKMQNHSYSSSVNDKLLSMIEVNLVTNMEIFFRELWKYFLLDLKITPKSVRDKKFERYQLEGLISGENDFESVLASSFSFQNISNISNNLYDISKKKFQIKDIFGDLAKEYKRNFQNNISSLFNSRHKIVHENDDLGYGMDELRNNFYDVIRVVGEIYLSICKDKKYQTIMIHEAVMSFSFLEELLDKRR